MVPFSLERISVLTWASFALLSCVNIPTNEVYHLERWLENTGCGLYNYYLTFWKASFYPSLKILTFWLWASLMVHLRINLKLEGQCRNSLSIQRGEAYITPPQPGLACVSATRASLSGVLQPLIRGAEGNWGADRQSIQMTRQAFKLHRGLRDAWEKTRWILKYELQCKHPQRPSGWNRRERRETWKRQADKFETSVSVLEG